jgi:hypothetical protein
LHAAAGEAGIGETTAKRWLREQPAILRRVSERRLRGGNLWRIFEGVTLTVLRHPKKGGFGWSISDSEGPEFSPCGFEDEEEALEAPWFELTEGIEC